MYDRVGFLENNTFALKMGEMGQNDPSIGFLEFIENFSCKLFLNMVYNESYGQKYS